MFRNRFWGALLAVLVFLLIAGMIGFGGYQMGLAQGAGAEIAGPRGGGFVGPMFGFFPFFWGFGLLKFFFVLFLLGIFFRVLFRPWRMGPGGHWKGHGEGPWRDRMKEIHDRWHAENDPQEPE